MSALFDLEQGILRCWNITDDIGEILDDLESGCIGKPEAVEALGAYQKVYQRRFERCFGQLELCCAEVRHLRLRIAELEQLPDCHAKKTQRKNKKSPA